MKSPLSDARLAVLLAIISYSRVAHAAENTCSEFMQIPITGLPGVASGSVAWGDYDNDGRLDLFVSGSLKASLWRNTASGFIDVTATGAPGLPGLYDSAAAWGDFDNDGKVDLLIAGLTNFSGGAISQVWRNNGTELTNVPIPGLSGVGESSAAWCDFDGDGRLDFLIAGTSNGVSSGAITQLWRNTGNSFTNVPVPGLSGTYFGSLACADFNNDGRPDFFLTGITNSSTGAATSELWRNTGAGFTNVPIPGLRGIYVSSAAWADYDNDGRFDLLLEGLSGNTFLSELWRNTGSTFTNVPLPGLPAFADGSLAWADYDNDGRFDFLITGLTNGATEISQLWRNTEDGFTQVALPCLPGNFDNALAWGDYDNDGRLDFLVSGTIQGGIVSQLWQNTTPATNQPPASPLALKSTVSGNTVSLTWQPPVDDHTPAAGLTYNLRIGTSPGGFDIVSPHSEVITGRRRLPAFGNRWKSLSTEIHLAPGDYYWSVQAIDSGFLGGAFAAEERFSVGLIITDVVRTNGTVRLSFTGIAGTTYVVLGTTNVTSSLSNWTSVGTATELSAGQFRFDSELTNNFPHFYRVRGE